MYFRKCIWLIGTTAALGFGCASQKSNTDKGADTASQLERELDSERQEFMSEQREQLSNLNNEISRLEVRLQHEAPLAGAEERAEWSQELFELKQQHQRAEAELERAENATPEEWAEMRGDLGYAVDSLQAAVTKMGNDVSGLFESDDSDAQSAAASGAQARSGVDLCNIQVTGTKADVSENSGMLVVELTTSDPEDQDELRERAERMSQDVGAPQQTRADERDPAATAQAEPSEGAAGNESDEAKQALISDVDVVDIPGGVRVIFEPAEGQQAALRSELEEEVERIQNQQC